MDYSKYVDYVNENVNEIIECVNKRFEESKDSFKTKIIEKIQEYLSPVPVHYEWVPVNDTPYDHSGSLVVDGEVSMDQTVDEFLENEYSGEKMPTFESGYGWHYNTFGNDLSYETLDIAMDIMLSAIRSCIEEHFSEKISDEDFEEIRTQCGDFDDIYSDSITYDFFFIEPAIEFVGIGDMQLTEVVRISL